MNEIISSLRWAVLIAKAKIADRKEARNLALKGISNFKKGKPSKEGTKLVNDLRNDFEFIGFSPNIMYIKESGSKSDTEAQWVHPFSLPTLLYKHKKLPYLILVNGNLDFNKSRLEEISQNFNLDDVQDVLGITG